MSIGTIANAFAAYQCVGKTKKAVPDNTGFMTQLNNTANSNGATGIEEYTDYLKSRFGTGVMIKSVGKDQKSIDVLGAGTVGTGNVVIAPNILGQMAKDPRKAAYYEGKIQYYFDSLPSLRAQMSIMGHEIHSSGIVIHPDGTVTHYVSGDLKPEEREKIEAQVKKEQEEKRVRRKKYMELSREAAERRSELTRIQSQKQTIAALLHNHLIHTGINYHMVGQPQIFSMIAYESLAGAFGSSINGNFVPTEDLVEQDEPPDQEEIQTNILGENIHEDTDINSIKVVLQK